MLSSHSKALRASVLIGGELSSRSFASLSSAAGQSVASLDAFVSLGFLTVEWDKEIDDTIMHPAAEIAVASGFQTSQERRIIDDAVKWLARLRTWSRTHRRFHSRWIGYRVLFLDLVDG